MKFWLALVIIVISSNRAFACSVAFHVPLPADLKSFIETEKQNEQLKSDIQAAVWGAFLGHEPEQSENLQTLRFYVGGVLKGDIPERIKVKTDKGYLVSGGTIYYLNLKKIDDELWTDIDVPQDHLDWDDVACSLNPISARCALYQIRHGEIKKSCITYIKRMNFGCGYFEKLPQTCMQYRDEALKR